MLFAPQFRLIDADRRHAAGGQHQVRLVRVAGAGPRRAATRLRHAAAVQGPRGVRDARATGSSVATASVASCGHSYCCRPSVSTSCTTGPGASPFEMRHRGRSGTKECMTTAILVFTRDLRVADHPALAGRRSTTPWSRCSCSTTAIAVPRHNNANHAAMLAAPLDDLDGSLRRLGAGLVIRRGDWVREVVPARCTDQQADVGGHALRRRRRRPVPYQAAGRGVAAARLELVDGGTTAVPPGKVLPAGGDTVPGVHALPPGLDAGAAAGDRSPRHPRRCELPKASTAALCRRSRTSARKGTSRPTSRSVARRRPQAGVGLDAARVSRGTRSCTTTWPQTRPRGCRGTSTSATVSAYEIIGRLMPASRASARYQRQLCWRDFHAQVLAASPRGRRAGLPAAR